MPDGDFSPSTATKWRTLLTIPRMVADLGVRGVKIDQGIFKRGR